MVSCSNPTLFVVVVVSWQSYGCRILMISFSNCLVKINSHCKNKMKERKEGKEGKVKETTKK